MRRFLLLLVLIAVQANAGTELVGAPAACEEVKAILKNQLQTPPKTNEDVVFKTVRGDTYKGCTVLVTERLKSDPLRDSMAKAGWKPIPSYWFSQNKKTSWAVQKSSTTCILDWSWSKNEDPVYLLQCTTDPVRVEER